MTTAAQEYEALNPQMLERLTATITLAVSGEQIEVKATVVGLRPDTAEIVLICDGATLPFTVGPSRLRRC